LVLNPNEKYEIIGYAGSSSLSYGSTLTFTVDPSSEDHPDGIIVESNEENNDYKNTFKTSKEYSSSKIYFRLFLFNILRNFFNNINKSIRNLEIL
jgi:hypothetical protein